MPPLPLGRLCRVLEGRLISMLDMNAAACMILPAGVALGPIQVVDIIGGTSGHGNDFRDQRGSPGQSTDQPQQPQRFVGPRINLQ